MEEFAEELADLDEEDLASRRRRCLQTIGGDAFLQTSVAAEGGADFEQYHCCLRSEAMGDHAGVDFCRAGHLGPLQAHGLLGPGVHLDGRRPVPSSPRYELLCIDDFAPIGRVAAGDVAAAVKDVASGEDLRACDKALRVYDVTGLTGDPAQAKDWRARLSCTAVGAEVMSKRGWVLRGYVPVGAPWSRRLGLSYQSLRAARLPFLAGRLGSVLASSRTSIFGFQRPLMVVLDELFLLSNVSEVEYHPLTPKQVDELVLSGVLAPLQESNFAAHVELRVYAMDALSS